MARLARLVRAHPDAASVLTLILLSFLALGRALLPGKVLSAADLLFLVQPWKSLAPDLQPGNPLLSDAAMLFQPWLIYAAEEIGHGRIPLWNPHVFAGSPFFANPQSALLFPLTWIALFLPLAPALTLIAIAKVASAGIAMYAFLRVRALHPLAALGLGEALANLGALYAKQGRYEDALPPLRRVFQISPSFPRIRADLSQSLQRRGDQLAEAGRLDEAQALVKEALGIQP